MDNKSLKRKCKITNNECYWIPVGNIRSTVGNNIHMTMHCKHCAVREDIFLTEKEYKTHENIILKEVKNEF
tara:strand:- start:3053 stop:3265 length:213 start_codon:yes stop_codon:yes gene_type:complete